MILPCPICDTHRDRFCCFLIGGRISFKVALLTWLKLIPTNSALEIHESIELCHP